MIIFYALLLLCAAQSIAWFQINGQFVNEWCKNNTLLMSMLGMPISYLMIVGVKYVAEATHGAVWPGRLITFACGIVVFTLFTWLILGEAVSLKTAISLLLTAGILALQLF